MRQDYSLLGQSGKEAVASGLANPHWFRPKVDPKEIRELSIKQDLRVELSSGNMAWLACNLWQPRRVYFSILVGFAVLAYLRCPLFFCVRRALA